jgi:hypothetical protein
MGKPLYFRSRVFYLSRLYDLKICWSSLRQGVDKSLSGGSGMKSLLLSLTLFITANSFAIDLDKMLEALRTTGINIEVHGIDPELGRYVGTYRNEEDFFDYQHFALISENAEINKAIEGFKRHDVIWVKGDITSLKRPLLHIEISELKVVRSHTGGVDGHEHGVVLPDELRGVDEIIAKIHARSDTGRMLVVDFKQAILPILVPKEKAPEVAVLGRGDLIKIKFDFREEPASPSHLQLKNVDGAVQVLESMAALHGQKVEYTGDLVMFPKSPQVKFNVFALQRDLGGINGKREYTIINFEDPNLFLKIRDHLQNVWDQSPIEPTNDRNKLLKQGLTLKINGVFNFVDPLQANPQLTVSSIDDIIEIKKK